MKNNRYKNTLQKAPFGYAYHKIILDDKGNPINYKFLEVNPAFEKLTGLKADDIINRTVTEVIPGIDNDDYNWIEHYGHLALNGGEMEFEQYSRSLKKWYRVNACSDEKHHFSTIFTDITKEKLITEKKFIEESKLRKQLLDNIPGYLALVLRKDTREIIASNKAAISIGAVPGKTCFGTSAMRNDPCPFCLADEMWKTGEVQSIETEYRGRWYEGYWTPLSDDLYMHYIKDITEIKKAEEILKANEKFLGDVFESIRDGISVVDKELNILRVNNTMNKWYPHKLPLEGKKCYAAYQNRSEACDNCPSLSSAKTFKPETKEVHIKHIDGSEIHAEVYTFPMTHNKGDLQGVIEYARDITKRKETEKALRESEKKYRKLIEHIDSIFWKFDIINNKWTYISPQTVDILGYEQDEWSDFDFWVDRLHKDDREWASGYCRECTEQGINHDFEYRFKKKDGSYVWIYDEVKVVMDNDRPMELWGMMRDITKRKQAEETLGTYENIFYNTNDMLAIIGFDGYFKNTNPAWYKNTGWKNNELMSKPFFKFIHNNEKNKTINKFQDACKGEKIVYFENRFVCKDETEKWFLWDFIPYSSDDIIICVVRDNTKNVVLEKEKDIFNKSLIERVKELTFLNNISKLIYNSRFKIPGLFEQIVNLMPHAFQYPERTFIKISGKVINLTTQYLKKTDFFLSETIITESFGNIEITIYVDFKKDENTLTFYNEKLKLLKTLTDILSNYISGVEAVEKEKLSEQRFMELFNNVNDIVFTTNFKGNILNVNKELKNQLGYKQENGLNIFTFTTPYSAGFLKDRISGNIKNKTQKDFFDVDVFTTRGKTRTCEVRLNIKYKKGMVDEIFGIARDVTELRENQNLLMRTIIDTEEKEKMYFAEELHDGIGPLLSGINMYTEKIQSQETLSTEDKKLLKYCNDLVNDAIDQIRIISNDLMPSLLNKYGLSKSIRSYVEKINPLGKVNINVAGDNIEAKDIPHNAGIIAYRGITELINNTLKHAGAKNIIIIMKKAGKSLVINYSDDGKGVHANKLHPSNKNSGLGIRNLVSRIKSLNGTVSFANNNRKGFSVEITIPIS